MIGRRISTVVRHFFRRLRRQQAGGDKREFEVPAVKVGKTATNSGEAAEMAYRIAQDIGSTVVEISRFLDDFDGAPVVGEVLKTLKAVREKVEMVQDNQEELKTLEARCTYITACVIVKSTQNSSPAIDVAPLQKCVEAAEELVDHCSRQGRCRGCFHASRTKDKIVRLTKDIGAAEQDSSLVGIFRMISTVDHTNEMVVSVFSSCTILLGGLVHHLMSKGSRRSP